MSKIRVLLIDDHRIFRDGIVSLFADEEGIEIVDVASNGEEAVNKVRNLVPDVLVLDITMPGISGIEVINKVKSNYPEVRILVLSMHTKEEYVFKAIRAGAEGYLPKQDTTKHELIKAIRIIAEGKEYFGESISQVMQSHFLNEAKNIKKDSRKDYETLTNREREVLGLVVEGLSNQEIAEKLFVHIRTVETHKTKIIQKLGLKNTVELVKFAIKNNLLEFLYLIAPAILH